MDEVLTAQGCMLRLTKAFLRLIDNCTPDDVVNWLENDTQFVLISPDFSSVYLARTSSEQPDWIAVDVKNYADLVVIDAETEVEKLVNSGMDKFDAQLKVLEQLKEDYQWLLYDLLDLCVRKLGLERGGV
jgi:hypothetical protein